MGKVNKRLLPIKAHFFFFMAAMGPILPQLAVLGKQIGIPPEVMGYITSILPIMYVLAKPLFGFVADYFASMRKVIFMVLIVFMTLSYGAFYFVVDAPVKLVKDTNNFTFRFEEVDKCRPELLEQFAMNMSGQQASCLIGNLHFEAYLVDLQMESASQLVTTSNLPEFQDFYACLTSSDAVHINGTAYPEGATCKFVAGTDSDVVTDRATFWLFVVTMCLGTIGFNVANSISDAICFDMLGDEESDKYGAQRVWGTIGFGATALLAGIAVDMWTVDVVKSFLPALVIMFIFSGFDLLSVSKLKLPKLSASESIFKDVWGLVTHPAIAIFLVFATIAGIIDSFIIYFLFWHVEEVAAETGYMDQIKLIEGCVVAAECLAGEVPFFFYSGKIIKKLGYVHCMSMCFFFYAVRLALISWIPNPWYLVGVELFFQGCTYALCYTCIVAYASAVAPPGTSATVQGLMAGMDDGLGFSIGSLIGGLCFKRFGGRRSFLYFAIAAICTCFAHIMIRPTSRKAQYLPKSGYRVPQEQKKHAGLESIKEECVDS